MSVDMIVQNPVRNSTSIMIGNTGTRSEICIFRRNNKSSQLQRLTRVECDVKEYIIVRTSGAYLAVLTPYMYIDAPVRLVIQAHRLHINHT